MDPELKAAVIANLSLHEGRVTHLYTDEKGIVTVGVGHALRNAHEAQMLPFRDYGVFDGTAPAAQIAAVWEALNGRPHAKDGSLFLLSADIDTLLLSDLEKFTRVVHRTFAKFDTFPVKARVALYDMSFQLGSFGDFPRFTAAVQRRDWRTAAAECNRPDASESRNKDTCEQLLSAAA